MLKVGISASESVTVNNWSAPLRELIADVIHSQVIFKANDCLRTAGASCPGTIPVARLFVSSFLGESASM